MKAKDKEFLENNGWIQIGDDGWTRYYLTAENLVNTAVAVRIERIFDTMFLQIADAIKLGSGVQE